MNPLRRAYLHAVVSPDPFRFDPRLDRLVDRLCDQSETTWVVNLGSGSTGRRRRVINVDIGAYSGVDVRADGHLLPFRSASMAGVLLRGVLEHVRLPEKVRSEVSRVLAPGGFIYVEVPFLQPFHLSPEDHRRFTLPGLKSFLGEFNEVQSGVQIGPGSALAWVLRESLAIVFSLGSERRYRRGLTLIGWATFWLKYLDTLVRPAPYAANAASAVYFLGRKQV